MSESAHIDFETRSTVPFGRQKNARTGYQYARHPETDVWCMSWAICDEPVRLWDPWAGDEFPDDLVRAILDGMVVTAHNAGFEWNIWNFLLVPRLGLPALAFDQMDCTAARAAVMALPRSLDGAGRALGLAVQKDEEGSRLMQRMAKPRPARKNEDPTQLYWWDDADRRQRLGDYCIRDTETERELDRVVRPLSPEERRNWLLDHRTNMRGVQVDVAFAERARKIMAVVEGRYRDELAAVTGGKVRSATEVGALKEWLIERGHDVQSLDKVHVENMLEDPTLDDLSGQALQLRQEAGKSSVAKLVRFDELSSEDGRMRENFLFHGANTGRLAGKGAQLQNLPSRGGLPWYEAEEVAKIVLETDDPAWAIDRIELIYGSVPTALSSCLRGCIIAPPGKSLFVADYSNIEGRVAAWLGGEEWKLDAFREFDAGTGPDLYKVTAGQILGITPGQVDKTQRNVLGKVSELALGFGGGVGAYQSMAAIYNVDMAAYWPVIQEALEPRFLAKARDNWDSFGKRSGLFHEAWLASEAVKLAWRARHPGIVKCWRDAEDCAVKALQNPCKWFPFAGGKCAFGSTVIGGKTFLISRLPNGRRMYRAGAKLRVVEKFGKASSEITFWGVDGVTKQWVCMSTYGGDLFQSFVQGIARDIMLNGWANVEDDGFEVVLSVHDEVGAEGDEDRELTEFIEGMERLPDWAAGCPVTAAGYVAKRYRKD